MIDSEKKGIQLFLYGFELISIKYVIMTPMADIFEYLHRLYNKPMNIGGIYRNFCISDNILVVQCQQGIEAQDAIVTLKNVDILFIGYAGGFFDTKIGEVYSVSKSILPNGHEISLKTIKGIEEGVCGYSPALFGDVAQKYQKDSMLMGCNLIDMETAFCSSVAEKNSNAIISLVLVTDLPGKVEIWEKNKICFEEINEGMKKLFLIVSNYVQLIMN